MQEVNITTKGIVNNVNDDPFSKQVEEQKKILEEAPGTAEQLKQFYNSEQWEKVREQLIEAGKILVEKCKPVIEAMATAARKYHNIIIEAYKTDPEVKKCYGIYKKTRKRKDKKKANAQNI